MKQERKDCVVTLIGVIVLGAGLVLLKTVFVPQGVLKALPYVCIGLGCGIFGHGMGNVLSRKAMKSNPDMQKQIEIEKHDERNIAIANCAKAKAYDMMTFVYGAMMLSFALMGVEMIVVLLLVCFYLFVHGYAIYYRSKYSKEM